MKAKNFNSEDIDLTLEACSLFENKRGDTYETKKRKTEKLFLIFSQNAVDEERKRERMIPKMNHINRETEYWNPLN